MSTTTLSDLFSEHPLLHVCAPMVRYSKLPFRRLVRLYDCHLAYSPMILADAFANSAKARDNELTTDAEDRPRLVVQFAANAVDDFVSASQLAQHDCLGVDLNCGCPQRWALKQGIGACLIERPDFVHDLVRQTRNRCRDDLAVSVKIRLHDDVSRTVDLCRQLASAGVSHLAVHGRTKDQRAQPVNLAALRDIKQSVDVPILANGDVRSLDDARLTQEATGVDGVMAARGLLENPAMFSGHTVTPPECVEQWVKISLETGTHFTCFHHHLIYMCDKVFSRAERRIFNSLGSTAAVIDYLQEKCDLDMAQRTS